VPIGTLFLVVETHLKGEKKMAQYQYTIAEEIENMFNAYTRSNEGQQSIVRGYTVSLRTGKQQRWMVGCALLETNDAIEVIKFISDRTN
jgi:hypothetical protein